MTPLNNINKTCSSDNLFTGMKAGSNYHSYETDRMSKRQTSITILMNKIKSRPTFFFLFEKLIHSDIHYNRKEKTI